MNLPVKHIVRPALAPAAIIGFYFTPVSLIGCVNRGLLALAVVLLAAAAYVAIRQGRRSSRPQDRSSIWRLISTAILILPLILVLGPLG
jgi:Na+-driven multidrug efflux pump